MKRLTIEEIRAQFPKIKQRDMFFQDTQMFDFGACDHIENVDRELTAELWQRKLLRLPFDRSIYTFKMGAVRIYLIASYGITIEQAGNMTDDATAIVVMSQHENGLRNDAITWFKITDSENILCGASAIDECENETDESFKNYTLSCISRLLTLSMLLNTKGVPKRHEPAPIKLNQKRARSGKSPISAVTYIDLSKISTGHGNGGGGEKSMHLRRGHIRHYDDGSVTWVRDTIVKADGDLKIRSSYQIKEHAHET